MCGLLILPDVIPDERRYEAFEKSGVAFADVRWVNLQVAVQFWSTTEKETFETSRKFTIDNLVGPTSGIFGQYIQILN